MKKKLEFRRDNLEGKKLQDLYLEGNLLVYSFTRQREKGDELVVVFSPAEKTLLEMIQTGGAVLSVRYFTATKYLRGAGPLLDFSVEDFLDLWDAGVNGVLVEPEEVPNATAVR